MLGGDGSVSQVRSASAAAAAAERTQDAAARRGGNNGEVPNGFFLQHIDFF